MRASRINWRSGCLAQSQKGTSDVRAGSTRGPVGLEHFAYLVFVNFDTEIADHIFDSNEGKWLEQ